MHIDAHHELSKINAAQHELHEQDLTPFQRRLEHVMSMDELRACIEEEAEASNGSVTLENGITYDKGALLKLIDEEVAYMQALEGSSLNRELSDQDFVLMLKDRTSPLDKTHIYDRIVFVTTTAPALPDARVEERRAA